MTEALHPVELTEELTSLLTRALERETNYRDHVRTRVRGLEIRSVAKELGSGTSANYVFTVLASPVIVTNGTGHGGVQSCRNVYDIWVYEPIAGGNVQVGGIDWMISGQQPPSADLPAEDDEAKKPSKRNSRETQAKKQSFRQLVNFMLRAIHQT